MKVSKVQWFHPDGENLPNGVFFQRGGWLAECAKNAKRFAAADGVGVVVFPAGVQVEDSGRAFTGSCVSEGGIRYDSGSPTRVLEGVSGRNLLKLAAEVAVQWGQPEVLVREADGKEIWVVSMSGAMEKATAMKSVIRAVSLLQWMGPRAWADQAEERQVPERVEKMLRDGHHAWFRVSTGEGVPTSRCWMVFNEPGAWEYWRKYGVTRVLGREGLDEARVARRLDTATTVQSGFNRWANRGMLYGGRFKWEKGEEW